MKVTVDIDCTPEEARTFLGLPDVKPMQEQMLRDLQARMSASIGAADPAELMRAWLPGSAKGFEQMQALFAQMAGLRRD